MEFVRSSPLRFEFPSAKHIAGCQCDRNEEALIHVQCIKREIPRVNYCCATKVSFECVTTRRLSHCRQS